MAFTKKLTKVLIFLETGLYENYKRNLGKIAMEKIGPRRIVALVSYGENVIQKRDWTMCV